MKKKNTNFIIFGQSRSGSTLLMDLIKSHPEINCETELFNYLELFPKFKPLRSLFRSFPLPYIYYRAKKTQKAVYGFKLFFFQVHNPEKCLAQLARKNWKFIHIKRQNLLRQSLSNIIAMETNHWHRRVENKPSVEKIEIKPERLLHVLKNRTAWKLKEKKLIEKYNHITITYEDDLMDKDKWQQTANKVFRYLEIDPIEVNSELKKTYKKPYTELILNFAELKKAVQNSPFSYLLENDN